MDEKANKILRVTAYASGLFTLFIGVLMILGFLQLRQVDPLDNPSLIKLKEQYDTDPNNQDLKEQVRALDLMSRRAFFASRWQLETGTWLLIGGSIMFIVSLRLLASTRRKRPDMPGELSDLPELSRKERTWLVVSASLVVVLAFVVSQAMRSSLPDPSKVIAEVESEGVSRVAVIQVTEVPQNEITDQPVEEIISPEEETINESTAPVKVATISSSSSPNFPFFRGAGSRGIVKESGFPTSWNGVTGENIIWKTEIPSPGFSSPIIWNDKIFLTGAIGIETEVLCYNRLTGKLLWRAPGTGIQGEPAEIPLTSEDTGLAAPTAATNGEVVVAIFATGNLLCLDMEGKRLWAKNLGTPDNHYGHSSSLIISKNVLLVQYDHFKSKSLKAFNVFTGELLWEKQRQVAVSWASPVIATFNGQEQVILNSEPLVISYDIASGRELWSAACMSGEVGPSVAVNSKYVFAVNDFAKLSAIDPTKGGAIVWEDNEYTPEVASPVATEKWLWVLTSWGAVACYNTENGELAWSHDYDYGFYSSPMVAGDLVYMLDKTGVMHIVKAAGEYQPVGEASLGDRTDSTPAFYDKKIYIRTVKYLFAIGTKN